MTVSVLEKQSASFTATTTAGAGVDLTFATTPQPGDIVIAIMCLDSNPAGGAESFSGLGATFAAAKSRQFVANAFFTIYIGTGANAAGVLRANRTTAVPSVPARALALLVRGLPSAGVYYEQASTWNTGDNPGAGGSVNLSGPVGPDSLVLGVTLPTVNTVTFPSAATSPGFTSDTGVIVGNDRLGVAWQEFNAGSANVTLGVTSVSGGGYVPIVVYHIGGPDGTRLASEYAEVATQSASALALDGEYAEVLGRSTLTPALALDATYTEVLSFVAPPPPYAGPTPTVVTNKTLWLRASDLTGADGSAQTVWTDQSGKGNHVSGMNGCTLELTNGPKANTKALRAASGGIPLATPTVLGLALNPDITATSNDSQGGYGPGNLVDGALTPNGWATNAAPTVGAPRWVRFQMTVPTVVTSYQIYPAFTGATRTPKDWTFEGSMDGTTWTTLDTRTGVTSWPSLTTPNSYSFANSVAYAYYRLSVTANVNAGDICHWQEVTLNNAVNNFQGGELWILAQLVTDNGGAWVFGSSGSDNHFTYQGSVYNDFGNATRRTYTPTLPLMSTWRLIRVQITKAGVVSDFIDNIQQQRVTGVPVKWGATAKLSSYWQGRFAEALLVPGGTTFAQKQQLTDYYNGVYNLNITAPSPSVDDAAEPPPAGNPGFWGMLIEGVPPPPIDPATLAGKSLWLRAKDAAATVTAWADKSGTDRHAVLNGTAPVVSATTPNGGKAVQFSAVGHFTTPGPFAYGTDVVAVTASTEFNSSELAPNVLDGTAATWSTLANRIASWVRFRLATAVTLTSYGVTRADNVPTQNATGWTFEGCGDAIFYNQATATASSSFSSEPPANAIDGNPATFWTTNGVVAATLQLQFALPVVKTGYTIRRRDDLPNRNPKDWTFQGSNDGSAWTTLDTRTGVTWPTAGETKTFTFTNTNAYLYYRFNITANNGDVSYTSIGEVEEVWTVLDTQAGLTWPTAGETKTFSFANTTAYRAYRLNITTSGSPTYATVREIVLTGLNTLTAASRNAEAWLVVKSESTTTLNGHWAMNGPTGTSAHSFLPYSDGRIIESFGVVNAGAFGTSNVQSWKLYRVTSDGTTLSVYLDGALLGTATVASCGGASWAKTALVGGTLYSNSVLTRFTGKIAEVFVRDRISTPTEVADLIKYFNTEHGLTVPGGSP